MKFKSTENNFTIHIRYTKTTIRTYNGIKERDETGVDGVVKEHEKKTEKFSPGQTEVVNSCR